MIKENKYLCDHKSCENEPAVYTDGKTHICSNCTNEVLEHLFNKLSSEEKIKCLNWDKNKINHTFLEKADVEFKHLSIPEKIALLNLSDKLYEIK